MYVDRIKVMLVGEKYRLKALGRMYKCKSKNVTKNGSYHETDAAAVESLPQFVRTFSGAELVFLPEVTFTSNNSDNVTERFRDLIDEQLPKYSVSGGSLVLQ